MRILKGLGALLLLLIVALAGLVGWYVWAVSPKISGTLALKGLSGPVDVVRDENGVPHIYAKTPQDAQFALGFVHAQDRLWQMETHRRIANGRLAEVVGAPGLEADRFLRTLGVRRSAEAIYAAMAPDEKAFLDAYASGVNAYLSTRTAPLPPEFQILQAPAPEPWTGPDTVGWIIMMAWDLGSNWSSELTRMRLTQMGWSTAKIDQFMPNYMNAPYPAHADYASLYKDILAAPPAKTAEALIPLPQDTGLGSNNWVVAGSRTQSGKPLLANDPHLALSAPALWYFAHLSAPGLNTIGATLPGVPFVILGRNDRIAWGFTTTNPDVQDLYIEKVSADGKTYETPDGPKPFETVTEVIRVKGQADVTVNVRVSRHGPVISDGANPVASDLVKDGYAIAFQWTALRKDNTSAIAAYGINTAKNLDEFKAAASRFVAPQQNMVYADVDGNIAYFAPAMVPVREPDNDLMGLAPNLGWQAKYDWTGFLPMDQVPQLTNPERGYHYTANEKVVPDDYKPFITYDWTIPHRANRIKALIEATPKHDIASFQTMQADTLSLAMRKVLPLLTTVPGTSEEEKTVIAQLKAFDGNMVTYKTEPLIAAAWMREFTRLVMEDDLGPLFPRLYDHRQFFIKAVLDGAPYAEEWCDDIRTPQKETCADQKAKALTLALADLKTRYGNDRSRWQWGEAHMARSAHRPFSQVAALRPLFDIMVPVPGDSFTVNVNRYNYNREAEPFVSTHAASLRAIYDLSNPEKSVFMHSTGQSGLFFSALYRSLNPLWADVKHIPMRTTREAVDKGALGTLHLAPQQ